MNDIHCDIGFPIRIIYFVFGQNKIFMFFGKFFDCLKSLVGIAVVCGSPEKYNLTDIVLAVKMLAKFLHCHTVLYKNTVKSGMVVSYTDCGNSRLFAIFVYFFSYGGTVQSLREDYRKIEVIQIREFDIPFYRRYLMDRDIIPMTEVVAIGDKVDSFLDLDSKKKKQFYKYKTERHDSATIYINKI